MSVAAWTDRKATCNWLRSADSYTRIYVLLNTCTEGVEWVPLHIRTHSHPTCRLWCREAGVCTMEVSAAYYWCFLFVGEEMDSDFVWTSDFMDLVVRPRQRLQICTRIPWVVFFTSAEVMVSTRSNISRLPSRTMRWNYALKVRLAYNNRLSVHCFRYILGFSLEVL